MDNFNSRQDERYHGIELATIEHLLQVYCRALTGKEPHISGVKKPLPNFRNSWWEQLISGELPCDAINIYLPPDFSQYPTYEDNFAWYKAASTQQIGHAEFGSFDFCFEKESALFENLRYQVRGEEVQGESSFARYFSLFGKPALAAQAFTAMENIRVNYLVKYYYSGLKWSYTAMQENMLREMQFLPGMTLRYIFLTLLEGLETGAVNMAGPGILCPQLEAAAGITGSLCHPSATVEDAAEAAIRAYNLALSIPENRCFTTGEAYKMGGQDSGPFGPSGREFTVAFDLDKLKALPGKDGAGAGTLSAVGPKGPADSTHRTRDISDAQLLQSSGIFSAGIPGGTQALRYTSSNYQKTDLNPTGEIGQAAGRGNGEKLFSYDEWDFRTGQYLREWCCVHEKTIREGNSDYFNNTLETRKALLSRIKKQFEKLPAGMLHKARNLEDGDEYDLDLVIGELIDKKAGHTPSGKVYWKKHRTERDVAVAFLLDMSGSTADLIKKDRTTMRYDEVLKYDSRKSQLRRRIIDVEKETVVLLCAAIEKLGDTYGIYGFSGHGRTGVQYLVIKDINEPFSEAIKRRVDRIAPIHGTRMGPAIRHTIKRLEACCNSLKLLFLVSDGYPQDAMYGRSDDDKQYAINDTRMALAEACRKKITPFCLTVDSAGTDYLRTMCGDIGYEVLDDIEMLPQRLPALYKKLTD